MLGCCPLLMPPLDPSHSKRGQVLGGQRVLVRALPIGLSSKGALLLELPIGKGVRILPLLRTV